MSRQTSSLYTRQLLTLILAGSIPLLLLLGILHRVQEKKNREQAYDQMTSVLSMAKLQLEERCQRHLEEARAISSLTKSESPEEIFKLLKETYEVFNRDDSLFAVLAPEGFPLAASRSGHIQVGVSKAFHKALEGEANMCEAHPLLATGELVTTLYHPVENSEGEVICVVRTYVPIREIAPVHQGEGKLIWVNNDLEMVFGADEKPFASFSSAFRDCALQTGQGICQDAGGTQYLFASEKLDEIDMVSGGHLVHLLPLSQARATLRDVQTYALLAGLLSFGLLAILSLFASARISKPLHIAAQAAGRVASGHLDVSVPAQGPREVQELAQALNTMTSQVRQKRESLEEIISERTERLHEMSVYTRAIMDGLEDALIVVDPDGTHLRYVNRAGMTLFELDPDADRHPLAPLKTTLDSWFPGDGIWREFWTKLAASSTETRAKRFPVQHPTNPNISCMDITSAPVPGTRGRLWLFRDVTEQERIEAKLRQSQKIEAVGRLAGGLAHDFNNILTAIQGGLELVQYDLRDGRTPDSSLQLSLTGCQRAASIVNKLLSFSREHPLKMEIINIKDVVEDTITLTRPSLDRLVRIHAAPSSQPIFVEGDPVQLEQVLMNLLINASHAMPGGGTIDIRTHEKMVRSSPDAPGRKPGAYCCIEVQDNGHGMEEPVREKIFDPFFTTKPQGKGTGLGLATSLAIMTRHNGWIDCESTPGVGTTFSIYLPQVYSSPLTPTAQSTASPIESARSSCILLVDDEPAIRTIARVILERNHHNVVEAGDGMEALQLLKNQSFDLVILDLTMPKMSGAETLTALREISSTLPVLICSGHSADAPALFEKAELKPNGYLAKPFQNKDLIETVNDILAQFAQL